MLFKLFPWSIFAAFICLISGYFLHEAAIEQWANNLLNLGLFFLWLIYAKVILAFSTLIVRSIFNSVRHYCSLPASLERVELSHRHKRQHQEQLHKNHKRQLRYRHQQLRNRFIRANDKKQALLLAKSIRRHLHAKRKTLPQTDYRAYRQILQKSHRTQNIEGLLQLHVELTHR